MATDTSWPIRSLHQIELTSHCNLRCVYCPSPNLGREKLHMTRETFMRTLEWVRYFVNDGTQGELNLAGIGESTMHPDLIEFVGLAREALGWSQRICFATNGLLVTEEMAKALKPYKPEIWVSLHRPEKGKHAVDLLGEYGMLAGISTSPATDAVDWAGQIDWKVTSRMFGDPCDWRLGGWVFVMADGRLTTCCFDQGAKGVLGHVNDPIGSVRGRAYELCKTCHQDIGFEGFRDRVEGRVRVG